MRAGLKHWLADWIPPHLRRALRGATTNGAVSYSGNFETWEQARRHSDGYDAPAIVERVAQAQLKVARGEAAYERDSVLFDKIEHSYPLLMGLLRAALQNGGTLNVVDIGGALGSTYFQCRGMLEGVASLQWNVVEQPAFVACGVERFQTEQLRFFPDLRSCLAAGSVDVAIVSGVLPYLEDPHAMLREVAEAKLAHVILDRTPLWAADDRLTVQSVPPSIYGFRVSYPAWILNRERVLSHFVPQYRLVDEFEALAGAIHVDGLIAHDTGLLFERRAPA
ncbi:MAG TPA: methyltransferase, TIGR04325 family [Planctomycetaceae bacterium]|jgi:putative methyltransferase (TIGR04325 family)|nr:methyltransferase, TIGR04325 family [Planctomycetaceae bacterium]